MRTPNFKKKTLVLAVAAGSLLAADLAISEAVLEEVIVTATRRSASVQDVPSRVDFQR